LRGVLLLGLGLRLRGGGRSAAVARRLQRGEGVRFLNTRLGGLGLDARLLQRSEELLAGEAPGLGYLVYPLLGHSSVVCSSAAFTGCPPPESCASSDSDSASSSEGSSSSSATSSASPPGVSGLDAGSSGCSVSVGSSPSATSSASPAGVSGPS